MRIYDGQKISKIFFTIIKKEGYRAFFQGIRPSIFGIFVYKGTSFFFFEQFKHLFKNISDQSHYRHGLAASAATMFGQILGYPFEVVKRRLMVMDRHFLQGLKEVSINIFKENGTRGFFKGLTLNFIKSPLANGVSFSIRELLNNNVKL